MDIVLLPLRFVLSFLKHTNFKCARLPVLFFNPLGGKTARTVRTRLQSSRSLPLNYRYCLPSSKLTSLSRSLLWIIFVPSLLTKGNNKRVITRWTAFCNEGVQVRNQNKKSSFLKWKWEEGWMNPSLVSWSASVKGWLKEEVRCPCISLLTSIIMWDGLFLGWMGGKNTVLEKRKNDSES